MTSEFSTAAFRMGHSLVRQESTRSDIEQTYNGDKNKYFDSYYNFDSIIKSDMAYE